MQATFEQVTQTNARKIVAEGAAALRLVAAMTRTDAAETVGDAVDGEKTDGGFWLKTDEGLELHFWALPTKAVIVCHSRKLWARLLREFTGEGVAVNQLPAEGC